MITLKGDRCEAPWAPFNLHTWVDNVCVHCKARHQMSKVTIDITKADEKDGALLASPFIVMVKSDETPVRSQVCDTLDEVKEFIEEIL